MLQKMREQARGIFGWIILGSIILVLSVFGFGALNFFVTAEPAVAEVGDVEIKRSAFAARLERQRQQLMAQMGENYDPGLIDEGMLAEQVLSSLIERTLLLEGARDAGMAAPEPALDELILSMAEFQTAGVFDEDRFRLVLASAGFTPARFREALGEDLLTSQLSAGIGDTAFVTPAELRSLAALWRQERDVAWLQFSPEDFEASITVDEAALQTFFDARAERYRAPEEVTLRYVRLERDALAAEETVEDAEIEAAYAAEVEAFEGQERRKAAHILLSVNGTRSEEAAIAEAEQLLERLSNGEAFATLAEEYSDDPGSAAQGGDLGFATRGTFVPEFEEALFALEPGELSGPVVTQFGVHIIRLDEIARTEAPTFARMRDQLAERIRTNRAQARFDELKLELETLAYEAPDLGEPAEALGLTIETVGPITRAGGEGIFAVSSVVDAAFSTEVMDEGYNSGVLEPREGVALVIHVAEHRP
jgi:peptidyl-prolyl cis-trans isomerase D